MAHNRSFVLPDSLYVRSDIRRLLREIEALEESERVARVRNDAPAQAPSRILQQLIDDNTHESDPPTYAELKRVLMTLEKKAPVIHISFAANPTSDFISHIVAWFRQQVHPYAMIQIGLQPSIAAGCIVRTPSKYFDLTMRKHFLEKRDLLVKQLGGRDEQA